MTDTTNARRRDAIDRLGAAMTTAARTPVRFAATKPCDPLALFRTMADLAGRFRPEPSLQAQIDAAREWGKFRANAWPPRPAPAGATPIMPDRIDTMERS